ncbi:CheW domain-containing protein [Synechococcus sp. H65.1]|uniref:CheW domain-containing protein n=1 Tax=unclassified Synechococcus TaxID=2626047 RepID=UPI0039C1A0BE
MVGDLDLLIGDETQELREIEAPEGELFLKVKLVTGEEFALPAVSVVEVMSIGPEKITPMPNVAPVLLGTLNLRGEIIWVADLGQFLGISPPLNLDRTELPVVAVMDQQDLVMGLAVDSIVGMEWLKTELVRPVLQAPESLAPFLRGEWVVPETGAHLPLLDPSAILRSNRWG